MYFQWSCSHPEGQTERRRSDEKHTFPGPPHYTQVQSIKQTLNVVGEAVFTQTLGLLQPTLYPFLLFLKKILNVLVQQFKLFLVLALNPRSHMHAEIFNSYNEF